MGNLLGTKNSYSRTEDEKKKKSISTSTIVAIVLGVLLAIAIVLIIVLLVMKRKCPSADDLCYVSKEAMGNLNKAQNYVDAMGKRAQTLMGAAACTPLKCPAKAIPTRMPEVNMPKASIFQQS